MRFREMLIITILVMWVFVCIMWFGLIKPFTAYMKNHGQIVFLGTSTPGMREVIPSDGRPVEITMSDGGLVQIQAPFDRSIRIVITQSPVHK